MSTSRARTALLATIVLLVTFVAGVVAGALLHHGFLLRTHRAMSDHSASFLMKRLDRRLDLNPDQETKVSEILRRGHDRIGAASSNLTLQISREIERTNEEIDEVLTASQRAKFSEIKMKMQPRRDGRGLRFKHD